MVHRRRVLMIGCFDTKGLEFAFLHAQLRSQHLEVVSINVGVQQEHVDFPVDISSEKVSQAAGENLDAIRTKNNRSQALTIMGQGAAKIISDLIAQNQIHGAIGMGGGGGTYVILLAMKPIPTGIPKLCLSTVASKDLSQQVAGKDITLMPSQVDISGLNSISKLQMRQAGGALVGMINATDFQACGKKSSIAISMFGNTTPCVEYCTSFLKKDGFEVLPFHAVGSGGQTMEALITDGFFTAVLDITTTELADELCGGICSAGPDRLKAASDMGIPQVVAPGCLDMVNFAHLNTVPEKYQDRLLYSWAPDVTLMRTNAEENALLGAMVASRVNKSKGKVAILLPLKGISKMSQVGREFHDPEIDQILFESIKKNVNKEIPVFELDTHINDQAFARFATDILLSLLRETKA